MSEPIPLRMAHLPLDRRGLPVPVIILWTKDGQPIFSANDQEMMERCYDEDRCHICGGKLLRGRWLISGAYSALAAAGAILDGPLHDECAHYALKVCPYLAAPNYGKLIGRAQIANTDRKDVVVAVDETDGLPRPPVFVAQMVVAMERRRAEALPGVEATRGVLPKPGAVRAIEFWRHGRQVVHPAAISAIVAEVRKLLVPKGLALRDDSLKLIEERYGQEA